MKQALNKTTLLLFKNEARIFALRDLIVALSEAHDLKTANGECAEEFFLKAYRYQIEQMMERHKDTPEVVADLKTLLT